jgi:hypothetical protein
MERIGVASLFGMWIGAIVRARVSANAFRCSLMLAFLGLGVADLFG